MERFQPYQVTRPLPATERKASVKADLTKTQSGMEAVLAWAVAGAVKWYADGANNAALKAPDSFRELLHEFTRDMDTIGCWIDDNLMVTDKDHEDCFPAKAVDLWNNYRAYVDGKHMGKQAFYQQLKERGFIRSVKRRWKLTKGPFSGSTKDPAYWMPGLCIVRGVGATGTPIPGVEYVPGTQWGHRAERPMATQQVAYPPPLEAPPPGEEPVPLPFEVLEAA
jgi:phage/plasmid-associated DNA primase